MNTSEALNHETYDRLADWLEARWWTTTIACCLIGYGASFGLICGLFSDPRWFLMLLCVLPGWLLMHVKWHGFLRRLDRKYPSVAELDCSFDADIWNRALEGIER
jgi:hypothetical protein